MFWTNKNVTIKRINTNNVFATNSTLKCRYSPKKFISLRELETKQNHITFMLVCDTHDLRVKDKIVDGDRSFIVSSVFPFTDWHWEHLESLILETNTYHHENIDIISLSQTQNNYDSTMWEWIGNKNTTTRTVSALVDYAKLLKWKFIKMLDWGKIEDTELVVTLMFPETIDKLDKIVYNGNTYEITWIIPFAHQLVVWINKYIKDYEN